MCHFLGSTSSIRDVNFPEEIFNVTTNNEPCFLLHGSIYYPHHHLSWNIPIDMPFTEKRQWFLDDLVLEYNIYIGIFRICRLVRCAMWKQELNQNKSFHVVIALGLLVVILAAISVLSFTPFSNPIYQDTDIEDAVLTQNLENAFSPLTHTTIPDIFPVTSVLLICWWLIAHYATISHRHLLLNSEIPNHSPPLI